MQWGTMSNKKLGGQHTLQYGTRQIEYELTFAERKDLAIHVYPDGSVIVEAPHQSTMPTIEAKVHKRARWIIKQQGLFNTYGTQEIRREYVSGETHFYLGKRYRLKIVESPLPRVTMQRGRIIIETHALNDWQVKHDALQNWYQTRANFVFQERLEQCHAKFVPSGVPLPTMQIRPMKSRWGSYTPSGKILLNLRLIQVPKKLIDYVITHELCHAIQPNHSPAFYDLLTRMCPDWRILREQLNQLDLR
jgi:predicted metal-dependent hydrolase